MDARCEGFAMGTGPQMEHILPEDPTLTSICSNENDAPSANKPLQSRADFMIPRRERISKLFADRTQRQPGIKTASSYIIGPETQYLQQDCSVQFETTQGLVIAARRPEVAPGPSRQPQEMSQSSNEAAQVVAAATEKARMARRERITKLLAKRKPRLMATNHAQALLNRRPARATVSNTTRRVSTVRRSSKHARMRDSHCEGMKIPTFVREITVKVADN
ncbi:hypothetical protein PIB30_051383 [Stylosanthes scabra]|uniref:Uncharacterized protein n=1 Tax=Stylosanthes scabra TaxID=79078 RepID=A0ABU6SHQ8_9FABA|nr:hypothetical protein [Stylosanthes scabra]